MAVPPIAANSCSRGRECIVEVLLLQDADHVLDVSVQVDHAARHAAVLVDTADRQLTYDKPACTQAGRRPEVLAAVTPTGNQDEDSWARIADP
jgi:hypothetical protein